VPHLTDDDIDEILQVMRGAKKRKRSIAALGPKERLNLKAKINQAWTRQSNRQERERRYATYKELKRIEQVREAARDLLAALNEVGWDLFVYWSEILLNPGFVSPYVSLRRSK